MRGNDGWQIKKIDEGWMALFTPNVDQPEHTFPPKEVYETRQEAVAYAEANYTAKGVIEP